MRIGSWWAPVARVLLRLVGRRITVKTVLDAAEQEAADELGVPLVKGGQGRGEMDRTPGTGAGSTHDRERLDHP